METKERIYAEPETMGSEECRRVLDIGRSTFFELARRDQLPVPTIRVGKQFRFSRRAVEAMLDGRKTDAARPVGTAGH